MTKDVNVQLLDFGSTATREVVTENEDGSYTIFINSRLSTNLQEKAYKHAMWHIEHDDFEKPDVQIVEKIAHQAKTPEAAPPIPANRYARIIKRLRAERKKIQEQMEEMDRSTEFLLNCGVDFFAKAERDYLYGNDK